LFIGLKGFLNKRLFLITNIGQNTLPVFLLHGFIIKALPVYFPDLLQYPLITLLLSVVILLIFGNKLFNKAVYYIGFSWLERFF
jgi:fucose 4-O-acetylase-like acetyltransferase